MPGKLSFTRDTICVKDINHVYKLYLSILSLLKTLLFSVILTYVYKADVCFSRLLIRELKGIELYVLLIATSFPHTE